MLTRPPAAGPRVERYYVKHGNSCDPIMRCADCRAIVLMERVLGDECQGRCEHCGAKRFKEITTLTDAEQAQVRTMDFPFKDEFIAEFPVMAVETA